MNRGSAGVSMSHAGLHQTFAQVALPVRRRRRGVHPRRPARLGSARPAVQSVKKIHALPGLDPRTRTSQGYNPEFILARLFYCLCSDRASIADVEWLNAKPLVRELARVDTFADQTQIGEWLRTQTDASIAPSGNPPPSLCRGSLRGRLGALDLHGSGRGFSTTRRLKGRAYIRCLLYVW